MTQSMSNTNGGISRRTLVAGAGLGLLATTPLVRAAAAEPVTLTIWSWVPNMQDEAIFMSVPILV